MATAKVAIILGSLRKASFNRQLAKAVERLPFLLAVIALAVVSAALTHTWARRKLLQEVR